MTTEKALSNCSGFTLLEVLVAMLIMVIAFGSIFTIQTSAIQITGRAKQTNTIAMLLRNSLTQAELEVQGKKFDEVSKEKSGAFEPPFEVYSWSWKIKELEFPNLIGRSNSEDSSQSTDQSSDMIGRLVTKFLSQSVRQIEVTVKWKQFEKEQTYSATTLWVDLNHEMALNE